MLGKSRYAPAEPMGKMFVRILATFAEFEADLIRTRTREGMAIARAEGKISGNQRKLSDIKQQELHRMRNSRKYSTTDLAELYSISRSTVCRSIARTAESESHPRGKRPRAGLNRAERVRA